MADELRLKVSAADYQQRIGMLDNKMTELNGILTEYKALQNNATKVLGDNDSNLEQLKANVESNIKAVNGQMELLRESRDMLQKQMDNLDELSSNVNTMFQNTMQTAKTAFQTVKIVGDLVN